MGGGGSRLPLAILLPIMIILYIPLNNSSLQVQREWYCSIIYVSEKSSR